MRRSWRLIGNIGIIKALGRLDKASGCIVQKIHGDAIELMGKKKIC